jgi:peptide/nickel transport system ATP-binding protein
VTHNAEVVIADLSIRFPGKSSPALDKVSLTVPAGSRVGVVGESGAGKTLLSLAIMGLTPPSAQLEASQLTVGNTDLLSLTPPEAQRIRGALLGMVFQNPSTAFNPVRSVGFQITRTLRRHQAVGTKEAHERAIEALAAVGLPAPEERFHAYPHQLSGGQLQRAMIAMSLINDPSLLIADEPTTALDATIQAQILELLDSRLESRSLILITHDLAVAAQLCDEVLVLKDGRMVEQGPMQRVLHQPEDPYTRALVQATPQLSDQRQDEAATPTVKPLLTTRGLRVEFASSAGSVKALRGVDLEFGREETVAVVGESGSGKSTLALALMGVLEPAGGQVQFSGESLSKTNINRLRKKVQMILQDPYSTLDPRWRVDRIIAEPLTAYGIGDANSRGARVKELLAAVDLPANFASRRPHQLSGGQRQRVAIARALALEPDLLVADEPVSALDMSVQAQIVALLKSIQERQGVGLMIISHDLPLVRQIADRIVVFYLGRVVEMGPTAQVIEQPLHPYTDALRAAVPAMGERRGGEKLRVKGDPPSPINPPSGCAFHPRCSRAQARCGADTPQLEQMGSSSVSCFYPLNTR